MSRSDNTVQLTRIAGPVDSLSDSAEAVFGQGTAIAMLYGPRPLLGVFQNQSLRGPDGPINVDLIYRADIFNKDQHLRWYRPQGSDQSRSVVLAENPLQITGMDERQTLKCRALEQNYLFWPILETHPGHAELPDGWHWAGSGRTSSFAVPSDHGSKHRIVLVTKEYLVIDEAVTDDLDGNSFVIDERFVDLKPIDSKSNIQATAEASQ